MILTLEKAVNPSLTLAYRVPSDLWARHNKKLNVTYMTCDKI